MIKNVTLRLGEVGPTKVNDGEEESKLITGKVYLKKKELGGEPQRIRVTIEY